MIKLAFKMAFFLVGVGTGIYVGVHYPAVSGQISNAEQTRVQAAVAQAKVDILNQVVADQQKQSSASSSALSIPGVSNFTGGGAAAPDPVLTKYQTMLSQSQADLAAAKAKQ